MWWCPKSSVWELEGAHPCRCTICVTVFLLHGSSSFCDIRSNETPEALLCLCQRATPQFTTMAIVCNCSFAKHVTGNIEPKRRSKIGCSSPVSQTSNCHSRISTPTPFHCSVITPTSHYQVTTNPSNPSNLRPSPRWATPWWSRATSKSWNRTSHPWRVGIRRSTCCWSLTCEGGAEPIFLGTCEPLNIPLVIPNGLWGVIIAWNRNIS